MKKLFHLLFLLIPFVGFGQLTYIPDDNFEQTLIDYGFDDVLDDFVLTESIDTIVAHHLENIYVPFDLSDKNIDDLTGIEDFTALKRLDCSDNNLTNLDLSQNLNLEDIICSGNELISLELGENINLKRFYAQENKLVHLDLSGVNPDTDTWFSSYLNISNNYFLDSLNF